jgi:hypothetical protein
MTTKILLAAATAVALAAAGFAQASTVATFDPVSETGSSGFHTQNSSGTGSLDSDGTLTLTTVGTFNDKLGLGVDLSLDITEVYTGTISGTTWTPSGTGTYSFSKCSVVSGTNYCGIIPKGAMSATSVAGTVDFGSSSPSTVTADVAMTIVGTSVDLTTTDSLTPVVSPPPAVPLPPAVWLLGSGLMGLVGTARRRGCATW